MTTTILPPGCKRCRGPEVYHSHAFSMAVLLKASCSEWGSSIMSKSAPLPVIEPPTPAAKYSPPCEVSHLPAAWLSARSSTPSNTDLYSVSFIKLRTFLPKRYASSAVWVVWIIFNLGFTPIIQAGNR